MGCTGYLGCQFDYDLFVENFVGLYMHPNSQSTFQNLNVAGDFLFFSALFAVKSERLNVK